MTVFEGKLVSENIKIGIVASRFNEFITSIEPEMQEKLDSWLEETPAQGNELYEGMDLTLYYEGLTAMREAIETELAPAEDGSGSLADGSASAQG